MRTVFITFLALVSLLSYGCTISHRIQEINPPSGSPPLTDLDEPTDEQSGSREHADTPQSRQ